MAKTLTIVPGYLSAFSVAEYPEYRVIQQHRCSNRVYLVLKYVDGVRVELGYTNTYNQQEALDIITADLKGDNRG